MRTASGKPIEVLSAGVQNRNAGPDFADARIKIGGILWAGSVEIHRRTSDWHRHRHQGNGAYASVVLHVVHHHDCRIPPAEAEVFEMKYNPRLEERCRLLLNGEQTPSCAHLLPSVQDFGWQHFLTRLAFERLEQRAERIAALLVQSQNDWEGAFLQILFRAFGFGVNADPLERLAQSIASAHIAKHRSSLLQIEALLFGQAGFLDEPPQDDYQRALHREYTLLQAKFALVPMPRHAWRFLRIRPPNFPTVRIAQLAALLHSAQGLFAKTIEAVSVTDILTLFNISVSEYWHTHYSFAACSPPSPKTLGKGSAERLAANVCVPVLFCYGKMRGGEPLCRRAVMWLEALPPEDNVHTALWRRAQMPPCNMLESQALVQLTTEYCHKKRCLHCAVGRRVIED